MRIVNHYYSQKFAFPYEKNVYILRYTKKKKPHSNPKERNLWCIYHTASPHPLDRATFSGLEQTISIDPSSFRYSATVGNWILCDLSHVTAIFREMEYIYMLTYPSFRCSSLFFVVILQGSRWSVWEANLRPCFCKFNTIEWNI